MVASVTEDWGANAGAARRRVLRPAQIVFREGQIVIDCVIRDLSETGAQLATETPLELPKSFRLRFEEGVTRPVELVWSRANLLGVRFMDVQPCETNEQADPGDGVKGTLIGRVVEIERLLAELRAEISINVKE